MAIAKLSKVFSFFLKTNTAEKILKAGSQGKMPYIYMKNLQSVKNDAVRNTLTNYTSLIVKKSSEQAQMLKSQIDDITYKLNLCEDATIKSKAEKLILNAQNKSQTETYNLITKAELLLDSANSGKYSTLFNARTPIGTYDNWSKLSRKLNTEMIEKYTKEGKFHEVEEILQDIEMGFSEPRKLARLAKRKKHITLPKNELTQEAKYTSLKSYIELYPEDKETATYLWKQYFVSQQDKGTQHILNDIYKEFGVRVCFNQKPNRLELVCLKEHLSEFKKAVGAQTKLPALFDIRQDYFMLKKGSAAYTNITSKIVMPHDNIIGKTGKYARIQDIRHELAHMNDTKITREAKLKELEYSSDDVKELLKGDKDVSDVTYFFKNRNEANAVFAECDMQKVSEAFKHKMLYEIKGLPEGIVNIKDISRPKCALLAKFYNKQNNKIIDKLEKTLGGTISDDVAKSIISEHKYFRLVKNICNKHPKGMTSKDFINAFENKITEYQHGIAKAKNIDFYDIPLTGCSENDLKLMKFANTYKC